MPKNLPKLIFSIGICLLAGIAGSLFAAESISTWYVLLNKPSFSPPNWIFAPVWTILYILMGIALYLAISNKSQATNRNKAVKLFAWKLFLNFLWSVLFFGMRNPLLAFVDIIGLWILVFITIKLFYKINKLAGQLLMPYLLWVSFAVILNMSIVILNPK